MKKSSIAENVYNVNLKYTRLQNRTKEIFFECLQDGEDEAYFTAKLEELWGSIDNVYLEEQIREYRAYLHKEYTGKKLTKEEKENIPIVELATLGAILKTNKTFVKVKEKEYKMRKESFGYENNKDEYLKKLVPKYTSNVKKYKSVPVRFVKPSTYNSMVYNTCLTRNGWIQTLNDGKDIGIGFYYIQNHSFSCPHCLSHQEVSMTREECLDMLGTADEKKGDILHPNCKCELVFFDNNTQLQTINRQEAEEQYHIREKVMSLQLRREELLSDLKIYDMQGSIEEYDKTKSKINKVNNSINELRNKLPTKELKRQVTARTPLPL